MKVARILIYACLIMTIAAPAIAEHSAIIVFNAPSSYIGLWETTPSMAILTVTAEIGTPATQARFFLRIEHESHGEIATGESGMRELRAGPGAQTFMSPEIVNWRELDYSSSRIDPVRASGRLPEGEYTAFVEIRDLHGELLAETRESFFIVYTDPPMLLNPLDDEEPAQPNPIFMWTPVILPAGHTVTYHLRIVEVLVGQPAERAMEVNSPFYEAEITGTEVHTYPAYEIPFERSIVYAWQIEAVDESGNPAARNDGKSAINTFYYGVPGEEITTELEITAIPSFFIISRMDQEVYVSLTLREPGIIHLIDPVEITHVRYSWMESGTTWRRMGTWEELETPISILPASSYRFTKTIVFNEELRTTLLRGATTGTFGLQIDFQSTETDGSVTHTAPFIVFEIVEIGSEFTVRVIYPERMPITLSPTSPRQTFRYEFDGMGHSEIHVTSHRIIAISPFDGTRSEHRTSPVDVTIPAGGTATMDDFVGYDVSYIIETILGERTMDRLGHSVTELDLPWDMIFTGMEGDREVIGRAEVIFRVQREASSTFDVRAESPDGMPLVWHPGAETHPLTFELDGTGHSEIEITGRQFYKYYPASDREIDRRPWPIGSVRIPPGGTIRVDEGFELSADAQEALLHDPELTTALGDDSPLQVELQYRIVFEGIEHPEGSAEEFPVTGEVIIPALIREAREGEESLTVPVSLTSGVETPLIFHPEATEHGIELQVDGTGLGLLEMTSSNRTIHIPASSAIFSVDPVSHSGIAIAENTIGILPLDIVIDADRQAEILRRAAGGAHEVMGEYEIDVICDEVTSERRQVRHGRISIPILIRSSVINPSFDVRANSPDGIPLVWHPGQETNRIQFILDGTGHNEIELTGSNTFMGIPVIDSDTQVGHWPPLEGLGFHIPAGRPFTITSGIAMTMEQQQQRLNDPDLAAVSEGPVDELEIYYRFEFEGLETMEGGGERVPVFGQVTVPMIIHREVEGESPETFPLRLAEGADLPLVFHPGAVSFTVNLELDATGLGAMSYYSAESGVFIPASSGFFWADIDPPEISVEENTVLTYPWELAISPERQREILSSAFSVGGADRGFEDLEGEYLVTIVVMEGGTTIRRGTVNIPIIIRSAEAEAMASIDLTVTSSLSELVYAAGEEEKNLDFRLTSGLTQEVEMDTIIFSMERDGREVLNTIHEISLTVPAGGTADIEEHALAIDRGRILGTESTVEGELTVTFRGARTGGERVFTRMTIPMRVTIESEGRPATTGDAYVLVRNTAILMPTTETTIIRGDDGHITLNGRGRLVILPSPFDSTEVDVSLSALTLEPHDDNPDSMVVTGGRLDAFSEGEENLFTLYASLFQAKRISFDAVRDRDELLKIDLAHVNLPGEEPLILTNVIVNEHGISLEDVDLEYSMFGLTLRITDIRTGGGAGSSSLRLTVHMRLQGRTRSEEFASTEITITESGGIEGRVEPEPEPYAIIPGDGDRAILAISAIEFKVHPDSVESYVGLTVALNYPSPLEELGPSEFTLKIGSEGTITGEVALITEGEDDDLETDITKVDFGSFATFDLTYLAVQLQGSGDGFDEAHSFVAISGNFIFRRSESETYTIHFGDNEDEPGVRINFDGSVEWHDLMLATDQRINMGPVYIRLRTLGFEFSPEFKFILAGGLGVDKEDVFSGEILLETLKVDKNGNVDFDHIGIMGGSLSIMDMVGISVRDFDYCSSGDCSISFKAASGKTAKDTSITVESFFQIQGAEITIGEDGAAGSGGFEELLVFEDEGENNFVLRQAELNIAEQVEIKLDLRYLQGHPVWGDVLSLAGNVRIPKQPDPITASVYGKIGEKPDGSSTWGLFVSAGGLGIQMGPVTLDAVGGGFFYNPIIEDLAAVRDLCGIERPDISGKIEGIDRPEGAGYPGSFAAMLYAGLYVGSRDVVEGRALLAITERNVTLDAEITALDKKAQGAFYLAVGWDPNYLEGMFELEVNLYSIIGADADLMFYVYGEDLWSVMGESEIQLFPSHPIITVGADFFIGPPGFLLDMNFDLGFDIGILSAEARFETMYWYNSGVSWGAYILISAEGEILWGLAGVAGSLEGALIGTPEEGTLVYCVGSFYAELCWVTVFDGSVWMTLSGDGFDGGEGRNSKYDQLIEDARNMADQMRSDMDDMAEAMGSTGILSDEQLEAAGLALIQGLGSTSSVGLLRQYQNDADQYSALVPSDARNSLLGIKTDIFQHENIRQNVATLQSMEANKRTLSAYSEFLSSRHSAVTAEMRGMGDLLSADLPALSDLPALTNPVGAARYETINIDGRSITIKVDVEFNEETAAEITDQVSRQQRDIEEYQQTLFQLIGEYERNLTALDEFMGPSEEPADSPGGPGGAGDISPNELSQWYGRLFSAMNGYYETYLGLIYNGPQ
ncbi:hypothetical protein JW935_15005, partial [candidate division KSB1 bacterium]|nr:hypothetical protein [candidate division KSB1 bacterium]